MKMSTIMWIAAGVTVLISIFGSCPLWVPVVMCCISGVLGTTGN